LPPSRNQKRPDLRSPNGVRTRVSTLRGRAGRFRDLRRRVEEGRRLADLALVDSRRSPSVFVVMRDIHGITGRAVTATTFSVRPNRRHGREPVVLVDEVVVFASAWFDRPMTGRGVDTNWPDVDFLSRREVVRCRPRLLAWVPTALRPAAEGPVRGPPLARPRCAARSSPGSLVRCDGCSGKPRRPPSCDRLRRSQGRCRARRARASGVGAGPALRLAGEAVIGRIADAANRLPDDLKAAIPEVPWDDIRDIRILVDHIYPGSITTRSGRPSRPTCPSSSSTSAAGARPVPDRKERLGAFALRVRSGWIARSVRSPARAPGWPAWSSPLR
jgi:hypothetical protein